MTAEMDAEHRATVFGGEHSIEGYSYIRVICTCGWGIGIRTDTPTTTRALEDVHREHVHSLPGYVHYYRRPQSFDIDDEEVTVTQ